MHKIDTVRFKVLINKWKDPKNTGDINKLDHLADETIHVVNSEPLIKDICEIFLYAISTKAVKDPSFHNINVFQERDKYAKMG